MPCHRQSNDRIVVGHHNDTIKSIMLMIVWMTGGELSCHVMWNDLMLSSVDWNAGRAGSFVLSELRSSMTIIQFCGLWLIIDLWRDCGALVVFMTWVQNRDSWSACISLLVIAIRNFFTCNIKQMVLRLLLLYWRKTIYFWNGSSAALHFCEANRH